MKEEQQRRGQKVLAGCERGEEADRRNQGADPKTLCAEIIHVGAALNRWPEQAFEAAFAALRRIRNPKRLHGQALKPTFALVSSGISSRRFASVRTVGLREDSDSELPRRY